MRVTTAESVRVRLLGCPAAWDGDQELPVPGGKAWLLLAFLLEHRGRSLERLRLIDAVWPESPPPKAGVTLRALLSRLRAALGRELLSGRSVVYVDALDDIAVDTDSLRHHHRDAERSIREGRLSDAIDLATAALAAGQENYLAGYDAPWVQERRQELDNLREDALGILARAGLGLGGDQLGPARAAARELVARRPWSEAGVELLMRLEHGCGNSAQALLAYEQLRQYLQRNLGTSPGERLRALHAEVLEAQGPDPVSRLEAALRLTAAWHRATSVAALERCVARSLDQLLHGGDHEADPLTLARSRRTLEELLEPHRQAAIDHVRLREGLSGDTG